MATMKSVVYIDGDQGTTGLRIHELLRDRPDLELTTLPAARRKDEAARAAALNDCDIAVLCLPDGAAREAVGWVVNPNVRVIDASSAHRTDPDWVYGFAELEPGQTERIARARRVSNPGCYPTGALALLRPLLDAGLLDADLALAIHAVSGYSGRGRAGIEAYEGGGAAGGGAAGGGAAGGRAAGHAARAVDANVTACAAPPFQHYALTLEHKHVPEIMHYSGLRVRPIFVPAYGAFRQGIVLSIAVHLQRLASRTSAQDIRACLTRRYEGQAEIRVLSAQESERTEGVDPCHLNGSNDLELAVFGNDQHEHVLLTAVFDNLGKGAAGAAVQNLDLMLAGGRPAR